MKQFIRHTKSFLAVSKRKIKQLSIWPATFTHKHRGNPPLEGQKTYLTGWFESLGTH